MGEYIGKNPFFIAFEDIYPYHNIVFQVMGFSLFVIDSEQANLNKLDKKGLLHLGRIDKVSFFLQAEPIHVYEK